MFKITTPKISQQKLLDCIKSIEHELVDDFVIGLLKEEQEYEEEVGDLYGG